MGNVTLLVLALAAFSFVLGFVALLSSRIYINPNTKAKLAVDLPILGKMQTNYPALIFVFVGAALAVFAMEKEPRDTSWTITGQLREPTNQIKDWRNSGTLRLVQLGPNVAIDEHGQFSIDVDLPEGESFESVVQQIAYVSDRFHLEIFPKDELEAFKKNPAASKLSKMSATTRVYRPFDVELVQ